MGKITYEDKVSGSQFTGPNAQEIKTVVNALDDIIVALKGGSTETIATLKALIAALTTNKADQVTVDNILTLLGIDSSGNAVTDVNTIVDTVKELLVVFQNYPEGTNIATLLSGKVDKVGGKDLSTNDYTTTEKDKLANQATWTTAEKQANAAAVAQAITASSGIIFGLGTFNASTGVATIKETGVTFTPTSSSNQANGSFFDVVVPGTSVIAGTSIQFLVGGRIISRGTTWDYIPPTDTGFAKSSDNETAIAGSSNDLALNAGTITFDTTAKTIRIQGGVLNRLGSYQNLNTTLDITSLANGTYALFVDPENAYTVSTSLYNTNVSVTRKKQFCVARFTLTSTNVVVDYCISKFVVNGLTFNRYVSDTAINTLATAIVNAATPATSNDLALNNGLITFNSTTKIITVNSGGVLNRTGAFVNLGGKTFDFSASGSNDYALFAKISDGSLSITGYNSNVSVTKAQEYCIARFTLLNGTITKVNYCICDFTLNGVKYFNYVPENKLLTITTTNKTYAQVGDSISWQFDGKKENFRTQYPTETGYLGVNGYGQKICQYFGISYENHFSHGLNGRSICEYVKDILTPPNSDQVFILPKNCDIYSILLGTNDFGKGDALGTKADYLNNTLNLSDFYATRTVYGGLRKLVDHIADTTDARDKKIIFITPIGFGAYTGYGAVTSTWMLDSNGEIVERTNASGVKMSQIVEAIKWVADQIGAYVIDLYNSKGLVQKQRLNLNLTMNGSVPFVYQSVLGDNLHPNAKGQLWLGNYVCHEIDKIIVTDNF